MTTLTNKTALVTGGGSGIGQAIALRLAEKGAKVLIAGRNEKNLQKTTALHPQIEYVVANICQTEEVSKMIDAVQSRFG